MGKQRDKHVSKAQQSSRPSKYSQMTSDKEAKAEKEQRGFFFSK